MVSSFSGMPAEAFDFLRQLEQNNNRPWFQAHKPIFLEKVRAPMELLAESVSSALLEFAHDYATPAKAALYRIYRDTRFSEDKTPYKTHMGALFYHSGLGSKSAAAFYLELSTQHLGLAGGMYMPTPEYLRAIRLHLLRHHQRFVELAQNRSLLKAMGPLQGVQLKRPPRGFPADHPASAWMRHKQWYYWRELDPQLAASAKAVKEIVSRFRLLAEVVQFLNEPLLDLRRDSSFFLDPVNPKRSKPFRRYPSTVDTN